MKKYFLIAILLFASQIIYCQNLKIDSTGIYINSKKITGILNVVDVLGLPERTNSLINNIWTYDSLGVLLYLEPVSSKLTYITLDFKKHSYKFSPEKLFTGQLSIYGHTVDGNTSPENLIKIKELNFKPRAINNYTADSFSAQLSFDYFQDANTLEVVHIRL